MEMNFERIAGFRLACMFGVAVAAFGQSAPGARVVIVDSSGALVNTASRSAAEPRASVAPASGIDRNEPAVIDICRGYVEAQLAYLRSARRADGYLAFAERIRSAAGMRDGLYWPPQNSSDESPMGPKFAAAAAAELQSSETRPYFGYYFKILGAQGANAVGGARDYRVDGRMITGFALVAWPAEYGVTGVRTFQVNHLGAVYGRDLGPETGRTAAGMSVFTPDPTWTKVASAVD
jgi:hypothetical protein